MFFFKGTVGEGKRLEKPLQGTDNPGMRALSPAAAEMESGAGWEPWILEVFAAGNYGTYAGGPGSGGLSPGLETAWISVEG